MEVRKDEVKIEAESVRILARQLGRMLNDEELDAVSGGTCTCNTGGDCDRDPF